ncbi:MAG TPA: CPBP family intramembrane glutamic endopeptidase [Acidimicrobiia bacterium]|nr:CPBP family intramembrane glutamic endopeptidase [Acidimicrobiia bacterium]
MTLAAAVAPLAAYALIFQTILYMLLPARLRARVAPWVTGVVGAGLTLAAGFLFGFDRIGLLGGDPLSPIAWGLATVFIVSATAWVMLSREDLRSQLADPRLAALSRREAITQIFVRIPVFTALIEEAFFRGVLHAALIALYPTEVAIWLGAGLFGLWHIGPGVDQAQAGEKTLRSGALHTAITVLATTVAGVALVWLRVETGSIWAPVAVHASMNMTLAVFARMAARRRSASLNPI